MGPPYYFHGRGSHTYAGGRGAHPASVARCSPSGGEVGCRPRWPPTSWPPPPSPTRDPRHGSTLPPPPKNRETWSMRLRPNTHSPWACIVWSCNGTLWSDPRNFQESYIRQDIAFYTETHQSPECPLPPISNYTWELTFREETKNSEQVQCSCGVVVLFRSALISPNSVVTQDPHACFLWLRL